MLQPIGAVPPEASSVALYGDPGTPDIRAPVRIAGTGATTIVKGCGVDVVEALSVTVMPNCRNR